MHTTKKLNETLGDTKEFEVSRYIVETPEYAIAENTHGRIGVTWNKSEEIPNGFPHTYGHQQWCFLPEPLTNLVISSITLTSEN